MSICRHVVALGLVLSACGSSPEPCMRNSDCASNEYCSAGACLLTPTDSEGGVTAAGTGGSVGVGGSPGVGGAAGSTSVMMPDVSMTVTMTLDASGTASDADAGDDVGNDAVDVVSESDASAE